MFSFSKSFTTFILRCDRLAVKKFTLSERRINLNRKVVIHHINCNEIINRNCSIYSLNNRTYYNNLLMPYRKTINDNLSSCNVEHLPENMMDYLKYFIDPKSKIENIFKTISQHTQSDCKPCYKYHKVNHMVTCTITLKWPTNIEIEQIAPCKNEASYKASVKALMLLSKHNVLNDSGKLNFNRDDVEIARRHLSAKMMYSEDLYNIYNETEEGYEEFINNPVPSQYVPNISHNKFSNIKSRDSNILDYLKLEIDPKNIELAAIIFPPTLNVLNNFFQRLPVFLKHSSIKLPTCRFVNERRNKKCIYEIYWPEKLTFTGMGFTLKESKYTCANNILAWLLTNNLISRSGKPTIDSILNNHTVKESHCVNPNSGSIMINSHFQQSTSLFSYQCGGPMSHNQIRSYSTINVQNEDIESSNPLVSENDVEKVIKQFPLPKQILNNMFDVISKDLNKPELKLKPEFKIVKQNKNFNWMCIYELKWPESIKFTHTSNSKQDASNKAAIAVLTWLQKNGKINKHGHPTLINDEGLKQMDKYRNPLIELNDETKSTMNSMLEEFAKFKPHLSYPTLDAGDNISNVNCTKIIKQKFLRTSRLSLQEISKLPISDYREQIVNEIDKNQVTIIKGEPGCGKSTRVPQYILDHWVNNGGPLGEPCRIAVTQPRRIAAISLAERVAKERNEAVGYTAGYQVRLKSNFSLNTGRILYCTTGILLRQLQGDPNLLNYTHIILDEAHERDVNTDLLINLLRNVLEINPKLKVIVMSATLNVELFQNYYDEPSVIHVPGFTYPVQSHYLDSCSKLDLKMTNQYCKNNNPEIASKDVAAVIKHINKNSPEGAILCFLPGWNEIAKVRDELIGIRNINVLCLHSRLQHSEQWQIFARSPPGIRKIILSTNIAETSVTIDDVVYVVDTGISKEKTYDSKKGVMCLDNQWIARANVNQRIGRAGRVQPGKSYHLYPKSKYDELDEHAKPEILRTSLTKVVLDSKVFSDNMDAVKFFAELPTPPETESIMRAVDDLTDLGLLDENENLTPLGRTISEFQLEPKLAKSLVNAVIFKCVTPIVDIVTLFSAETELFSGALRDKQILLKYKKDFSENSDHLSLMRMFEKWLEYVEEDDPNMAKVFAKANNLNEDKLLTMQKLRTIHFGYLYNGLKNVLRISDDLSDSDELVKGVLLSGIGTILRHRSWDIVKGKFKKGNILLTRHDHKATITADSVNHRRTKYPSDYLLYINEVVSNLRRTTLVRETSLISPLALLLFKNGNVILESIRDKPDMVSLTLEGSKINFSCKEEDGKIIKETKAALDSIKQYYIYQLTEGGKLDSNLEESWKDILHKLDFLLLSNSV